MRRLWLVPAACLAVLPDILFIWFMTTCLSYLNKDDGVHRLGLVFGSILTETESSRVWPYLAPAVANFAFFSGLLLSWNRKSHSHSLSIVCRTDLPELEFARCLVGAALQQGYARDVVWPPQPPSSVAIVSGLGISNSTRLANEQLTRHVRPLTTTLLGLPALGVLAVLLVSGMGVLLGVLGPRLGRLAKGPVGHGLVGAAHSTWHVAWQRLLLSAVRMVMPVVCGAIAIVTTTMGVVLYSVAHIGLDTLADSGVFGLNEASVATLLELIELQWRFLQEINWSWWIMAMEDRHKHAQEKHDKREQREQQRTGRHEHHHHHDCFDHACPFFVGDGSEGDHSGDHPGGVGGSMIQFAGHGIFGLHHDDEAEEEEREYENETGSDSGDSDGGGGPVVHVHHHHHHYFYHRVEREKPGFKQRWFWWWLFVQRRRELLGDRKEQLAPTAPTKKEQQLNEQARDMLFQDFLGHSK